MNSPTREHERREATDEECQNLPHVADSVPSVVWVALMIGAVERFTFYAVTAPWQNYIQNARDSIAVPGALGLGQASATNISSAFYFFTYLIPLPFAIVSDAWLGRYTTLYISLALSLCGNVVLFATSIPSVTGNSVKIIGLAFSMVLLGLGTGGVKATISPFIGDQYPVSAPQVLVTRTGKRVVTDRAMTLQYIYSIFFWVTNIAGLSVVAATYLEKQVGFWAAYLLPLCSIWITVPLLLIWQKSFVKIPPQGNVLPQAARVILYSVQNRFRLDSAEPAFQAEKYGRTVQWDNLFVSEIRRGLKACKVMACFVPFHLCMNQMATNLISQAGQMRLGGFPNDTVRVLNPIACILLGPAVQKVLYPTLQRVGVVLGPISRMTLAFAVMSAAMAFAAGVQKLIYTRGPCYAHPLSCPGSQGGIIPNAVSIWVQAPLYFILAFAEILGFTTLYQYSYSEAPKNMRSLVQALGQLSSGVGSALGMAVSPLSVDPLVLYLYAGLAVLMIMSAFAFALAFKKYDEVHEQQTGPA